VGLLRLPLQRPTDRVASTTDSPVRAGAKIKELVGAVPPKASLLGV